MDDSFVIFKDLPVTIKSFVVMNSDMSYTIVLNSLLSYEQNVISYLHELNHIRNGDYEKNCSVDTIEVRSHCTQNI